MYTRKKGPNVWVVRTGGGFSIRQEGRAGTLIPPHSQKTATTIARLLARANGSELLVQARNGRIVKRDSHGADRFPPRG